MPCYDGRRTKEIVTRNHPVDKVLLSALNELTRILCGQVKAIGFDNCTPDVQKWYKYHEKDPAHES